MRDGFLDSKVQRMNYAIGIPKGLRISKMKNLLLNDFYKEKRHIVYFLPKFHPELNLVEHRAKDLTASIVYHQYFIHYF